MLSWRTKETEDIYSEFRKSPDKPVGCWICRIPVIKEFDTFKIIPNEYPYDAVSTLNHMIALKVCIPALNLEQLVEFEYLKEHNDFIKGYDILLANLEHRKTVPGHWHQHLLRLRPLEIG